MTQGITYVEIGITDRERSLEFYRGLLGFAPVPAPGPELPGTHWLAAGPARIKLVEVADGAGLGGWIGDDLQRGIRHVGLKVGDVPRQAERLHAAGVPFTVEPVQAVGDVRLAFFTDPDGTLLEIIDGNLTYHHVLTPELAERERQAALGRPADAAPIFDHVAVTVADLDATLAYYRDSLGCRVIGQLVHSQDPRGFLITYLQAGDAVLEVFTFTADTQENPWVDGDGRRGFRGVGLRSGGVRLVDPDGIPLQADDDPARADGDRRE